ncbi:MAG: flagellar hook assembly protein FlgD [Nitrosomonadales bacterium]|nr:flagellar hook assembly protein FlgD [Nitrosomonadales bacterium]
MINSTNNSGSSDALIASLNAANSSLANKTAANANSASAIQDRFLTMLTAQLKNQDPLNPMDNGQITSQMAQLSTVSGIDKLNATLKALSDSMTMAQSMSSTSMIGHGVMVPGSSLNLSNGQAIGGAELTTPADSLRVTITDAAGNTVRTLQLGAQSAGIVPFAWDGKTDAGAAAADGVYKFKVQAVLSGNATTPATLSFGTVNAMTPGVQGATLDVGQLGSFALSDVKQVM